MYIHVLYTVGPTPNFSQLQHTAKHCKRLKNTVYICIYIYVYTYIQVLYTAEPTPDFLDAAVTTAVQIHLGNNMCCSVLQCAAVRCSAL